MSGQKAENIAIVIGLLSLADICGAKLIMKHKDSMDYVREDKVSILTEEELLIFQEQNKVKVKA